MAIFVEGRQKGRMMDKNASKRAVYTSNACFEPTAKERASFEELQKFIYRKLMLYHLDPDKQLFLQINKSIERGFGIIVYHLKDSYNWKPGSSIPTTKIEPIIFFNCYFIGTEQRYRSSELEVVYLV
jgi:hypothetical protein